jgi:Protein of unknown function (DUF3800)
MPPIKGYFDESGDERDPQHSALAVAGYIAPADCWPDFDSGWQTVLEEFQLPHFHMRELQKRVGAFASWNENAPQAEAALLAALAGLIAKAKLKGCGAVIALNDLRRFNAETGATIDAKALGIYACALSARQFYETDDMELLFDRMIESNSILALAESYGKSDKYYPFMQNFPDFTALPKNHPTGARQVPGLQAADFLAWESRKNYELKRSWFEGEHPSPDSPHWGTSLLKWHMEERMAHMLKHGVKEIPIGRDLMRRSLSALADAAPTEGIIWDYRALRIAHNARGGIWGDLRKAGDQCP